MNTASRLKKSCTVAAAKARRNSPLSRMWPSETMVLVMVVPRLAPITMGMAMPMGRPPATRPTITEVTVLEDCTRAVARMPSKRATKGLLAKAKISAAPSAPPEKPLKP
ncbi:hypothetical protein D3C85_1489220 [compost metagenome]